MSIEKICFIYDGGNPSPDHVRISLQLFCHKNLNPKMTFIKNVNILNWALIFNKKIVQKSSFLSWSSLKQRLYCKISL